jgi:cytoskeletal protein CcmA (bactofilin family)
MGMFGKSVNVEQEMKKVDSEAISSIIDKTMTIKGEMLFKGKTRIDGTINGNIDGEHLILSETGKITGDINVSSFNCYGSLEGNVKATMLTARKNCSIHGKIEAGSLTVEPGASIQGEINAAAKDLKLVEKDTPVAIMTKSSASK